MRNIAALNLLKIGEIKLKNNLIAAPMAGISDKPFRKLCYRYGAGMTVSEMFLANSDVWHTDKSALRMISNDDVGIRAVQIVGSDPDEMAKAAEFNVKHGAQLIDINMGCPAKKVNKKLAGSALMQYPELIKKILQRVVGAVDVPVTLKTRTGWNKDNRNCIEIAQIAQDCGIKAITIHGRTRACLFNGVAEYESIKAVKEKVTIPVIANGDIRTPEQAKEVFQYTQADAIMIGRAAQGRPWIFEEIAFYLSHGQLKKSKSVDEVEQVVLSHLDELYRLYGEYKGLRIARKHVNWYTKDYADSDQLRRLFSVLSNSSEQVKTLIAFFSQIRNNQKS
ncbi:tRNA dihydrouridine synthase DusB [Gilliamella apicola]|uniref:tRNA dihydrouridine synthase DusB n=1 Tax=Gilliamella apicola TaxID=1196095 RepID=UPI000A350904|nr:tRNA dihydrouridine synthase DusB [Gilliamella apicola]OTP88549.1 tRNA dihydrouridine synthase DusB [Gilliamella apicola]OTP95057.1 tRNA dihydrouridine synthase DusB [Gilliamella apicola]OTQ02112.1 tRNA dihydrouridine synthase DusB [Gilliamella apicola]OTQ05040.1 tRNA dihydrouridine synthase DusB [Gilliamella apicola]OTQ28723.1 tRNA dihydrouridine synthase DusB [Gilliamella apicola]